MEAGLAVHRFPARAVAIVATLFAGLAIGGSLGYTIKPAPSVPSQSAPVVNTTQAVQSDPLGDSCVRVNHHKGC